MSGAPLPSAPPVVGALAGAVHGHGPAALPARIVELAFLARAIEQEFERLTQAGTLRLFAPARRAIWAQVAASLALAPGDALFGTRRDWPSALGRGVTPDTLARQLLARDGDPGHARSLPGALQDAAHGVALSDGPPASHLLHATGFGLAARLDRGPGGRVALALCGAGAFGAGDLHAAFSLAPLRAAHTIFLLRGPHGGEAGFAESERAWGLRRVEVDGEHGAAVFAAVAEARARALDGGGPTLIDARHGEAEVVPGDVLTLQAAGRLSSEAERALGAEVRASLWAARQAAEAAPSPTPEALTHHVRAPEPGAPDAEEPLA